MGIQMGNKSRIPGNKRKQIAASNLFNKLKHLCLFMKKFYSLIIHLPYYLSAEILGQRPDCEYFAESISYSVRNAGEFVEIKGKQIAIKIV